MRPCRWKHRNAGNWLNGSSAIATTSTGEPGGGASRTTRVGRAAPAQPYRGRFAPSPTGPLHQGSLIAATASYLQALTAAGEWLLRIEDIDPPRETPGAADAICRSLEAHGFEWTGSVRYQRRRIDAHRAAAQHLLEQGLAFACDCSRRQIRAAGLRGPVGPLYPGTCRSRTDLAAGPDTALRVRTAPVLTPFVDGIAGDQNPRIDQTMGDFILIRRDGLPAYAIAGTLDDHAEQITEVVRGQDLLDVTPAQLWLQALLGLDQPDYLHVPCLLNQDGTKLSKQTGAAALDDRRAGENIWAALCFLKQSPPAEMSQATPQALWGWAVENWQPGRLSGPRQRLDPAIKLDE